jgi:glutamate-ammonia-ligase adenylyltransferase
MKFQLPDLSREQELLTQVEHALEQLQKDAGSAVYAADPLLQHACYCSEFVSAALRADPLLAPRLLQEGALERPFSAERLRLPLSAAPEPVSEADFMRSLRLLRREEMVRIALRDLAGYAELEETLQALSELADFCLRESCDHARRLLCERHGEPVTEDGIPLSLIVLAMGKLGGGELNFSSDIDVIFTFQEHGRTRPAHDQQRALEAEDFFTRQARLVIKYLHDVTADGFVFRVDTRLRPFGDSGALVTSFDFMETYYQNQGRDWERYALIKARPVSGIHGQAQRLMSLLQPFVYRRYLDYGAFEALREMKALIMREVARKGMRDNIKLGSGGIREIEFIAQAFQLIRGGREPEFRRRELMSILRTLGARRLLDFTTVEELTAAYRFLRVTENRLQMIADQQTHRLPQTPQERARLMYAMGFRDWDTFYAALNLHRGRVAEVFAGIFHTTRESAADQPQTGYLVDLLDGRLPEQQALTVLAEFGFTDDKAALEALHKFRSSHPFKHMGPEGRERLQRLLQPLLERIAETQNPGQTLERILNILQAILQRSVYLALLSEYPNALSQLVRLCSSSGWIAEYLQAQPILFDSLLDSRFLYQLPDREGLKARLRELMQGLTGEDFEQQLNALRHFKHEQVLRVAALDVNGDLPLMKVSDQLTWLAEAILQQVHAMAHREMVEKYGQPWCEAADGNPGYEPELAVVAYGKLGGIELGYTSDLDVVFIHNSRGEGQTRGERSVGNEVFFARYGQRMIQILSTQTPGGILYEVDPRLRPDGASGPLVNSFHGYAVYQRERAWVWEHQALVRARVVAGSAGFAAEFDALRADVLRRPRELEKLRAEVRDMRNRMKAELVRSSGGSFDLKQDRGGITDIEFIVQYGVLAWARDYPELTRYPDNIRILEQFEHFALVPAAEARFLTDAYRHLRGKIHRLALQGSQAVLQDASSSRDYIDGVSGIWNDLMEN